MQLSLEETEHFCSGIQGSLVYCIGFLRKEVLFVKKLKEVLKLVLFHGKLDRFFNFSIVEENLACIKDENDRTVLEISKQSYVK